MDTSFLKTNNDIFKYNFSKSASGGALLTYVFKNSNIRKCFKLAKENKTFDTNLRWLKSKNLAILEHFIHKISIPVRDFLYKNPQNTLRRKCP